MICRWCHDIGREHAANRPLLRTVFQVILLLQWDTVFLFSHVQSLIIICLFIKVLMRLFSPRKTTLLLVIRDKTKVCATESSFFLYFCSLIFSVCLTFLVLWFFMCLQTPLEYLTQALKEDIEKVVMLYFLLTCFPLCHVAMLINHCLLLSDMGLCSETRSLQGSSA